MPETIPCQRHLFSIPEEFSYLNCAYMSPQLRSVSEAGHGAVPAKELPWDIHPQDFFTHSERARSLFAALIGAGTETVSLAPSASYGLATAALNLTCEAGSSIVVLDEQFPSNVYTWQVLAEERDAAVSFVARPQDDDWTAAIIERLQELQDRCSIVALPHCHWTDGTVIDLEQIRAQCDEIGAALVIDATQSLGALPLDVRKVRPDFLACASYKWLLGPYSSAFLYVDPRYHGGKPLEQNWISRLHSEDFRGLVNYQSEYQAGAKRFDVGERSNFILMPMLVAALEQIQAWGVDNIAYTLRAMTLEIAERGRAIGLQVADDPLRAPHMLGLRFDSEVPHDLLDTLRNANISVSCRGQSIRVSPHLYNTGLDIERLFAVLERYR